MRGGRVDPRARGRTPDPAWTPQGRRGRDHVDLDAQVTQERFRPCRLVAGDGNANAGRAQGADAGQRIRVEVVPVEVDHLSVLGSRGCGSSQVKIGGEGPEWREVILAALDRGSEDGEEREPRYAHVIGPAHPGSGFVDERLSDVEDDRPDQRLRSCHEVPPNGAPGNGRCFSPVRLSIWVTPRR
jgi:hypothetical protein